MKKRIMSIFSTSFLLFVLIVSVFITGCATTRIVTKFDVSQLNSAMDGLMELGQCECRNLKNKRIFLNFVVSQKEEYFLETSSLSSNKIKKHKYQGSIAKDIERKLAEALRQYCGAEIVNEKEQADITINTDIEKYYSQILQWTRDGSIIAPGGLIQTGKEVSELSKVNISTILSINNTIKFNNYTDYWKYNHLIALRKKIWRRAKVVGIVTLARRDDTTATTFMVDYDNECTLATGEFVHSVTFSAAFIIITPPIADMEGILDIYDIDTMKVKKHLTFKRGDFDLYSGFVPREVTSGIPAMLDNENPKKVYVELFLSAPGHLKYLIYDYIKQVIDKINRINGE